MACPPSQYDIVQCPLPNFDYLQSVSVIVSLRDIIKANDKKIIFIQMTWQMILWTANGGLEEGKNFMPNGKIILIRIMVEKRRVLRTAGEASA